MIDSANQLLQNVSTWYSQKKMQWSSGSPPADQVVVHTDEEVAQELKRIQDLVSQSKIPPQVAPKEPEEQYEHIDL
jgi:hypothetical protein